MKVAPIFLIISLAVSGNAYGQICSISHYPYGWSNRPIMHGSKLKISSNDLPFIKSEGRKRHSEFWVNADVLNVRSGPSLKHTIISETYYGNLVFAYAKEGEWIAIRSASNLGEIDIQPQWVNIKYLSANRINEQVDTQLLKAKCSFSAYGTYPSKINKLPIHDLRQLSNVYDTCKEVRNYLQHQQLLERPHSYVYDYETWRKSQKTPDEYSSPPCYNP